MTIRDLVVEARSRLAASGVEPNEAAMDARLLARETLGWDLARFLAHDTDPATPAFRDVFETLVARRARREPVSEILGHREFWGLDFEVTRDVLTPRPETEAIIEEALARLPAAAEHPRSRDGAPGGWRIAEVGTGSGCLAVCLALELPGSRLVATDVSAPALEVARHNAGRHHVLDRIDFRLASLLDGVAAPLDLVASNPPYVKSADLPGLPPEVRDYEPREALDGGPDGLDSIRRLLHAAARVLRPGAWAIVEFGLDQEAGVREAAADARLDIVAIRPDLQGIPRTLVARRPPAG